jgi:hypothetical protein
MAATLLTEITRSDVGEQVCRALESVSTAEVAARSGRQRGSGYVDPSEAAWSLLEDVVEPFVIRFKQLAGSGSEGPALEVGAGILLGLDQATGDENSAIYFEPEFKSEKADEILTEMESAGLDLTGLEELD